MTTTRQFRIPEIKDFSPRQLPTPQLELLPNGIKRYVIHRDDYKLLRISVMLQGGRLDFKPVIARIYGEMLKEGSRHYSGKEIADTLDFYGASVSSTNANHGTVITLNALRRNIDKVLPVFADMLEFPTFPQQQLQAVKRLISTELLCNLDKASYIANRTLRSLLSGLNTPYGHVLTKDDIDSVSRDDLELCHKQIFSTGSMGCFVAGNALPDILARIDNIFGSMQSKGNGCSIEIEAMHPADAHSKYIVDMEQTLQDAIAIGLPLVGIAHPDYWPLRMATHALGGYFGSRLMQNIRERHGYTYGITATYNAMPEGNYMHIGCCCDHAYTDAVLREINYELRRMARYSMRSGELKRLRMSLASSLASLTDTPFQAQAQYVSQIIEGLPADHYRQFWQAVCTFTPQQMLDVAHKYFNPDRLIRVIARQN